ncbi:MAG: GntR family transcriptional regulator [Desulfobacterales bacterium]
MTKHNVFENIGLPRSLVEDIANNLSDAIIEGRIEPGQQIIETDLQRALGVSRAPIREALLKLEGQGLVRMLPRRGTFVRSITPRFIQESFTMRAWLEGLAARLTAQNLGRTGYDALDEILADMGRLASERDFKGQILRQRIEIMRREALWLSYSITYFERYHQASQETHQNIIKLFRQGDADQVEMAVRSHILEATEHYVHFLKQTYPHHDDTDRKQ